MARDVVNIGMIGAGFIGQLAHLMNYVEVKNCRVLAVAEYRPQLRRRVAQRYEIPREYATHTELLADQDVDAVVVVTPRPYTGPVVLDCLLAGKHVISEKPMAGTSEQAAQLVATAAEKGLHYAVGYMKRHDEGTQVAKKILGEVLATGELGKVLFARSHCFMGESYCKADGHVVTDEKPDYPDAGWPTAPAWLPEDLARPYAAFVNTYSHNTNLLRYLFERNPRVEYARMTDAPAQLAVLDYGDFTATLETGRSTNRDWDEITEIYFTDGKLTLKTPPALLRNVSATVELYKAGKIQQVIVPRCDWTWSFRRQAQAFVDDILASRNSITSGEDSQLDLQLIEEIWRVDLARGSRKND